MQLPNRAIRSVLLSFLLLCGFPALVQNQRNYRLVAAQKDSRKDSKKSPHVYTNDDPIFHRSGADARKDSAEPAEPPDVEGESLAGYAPSPMEVVERMLESAKVSSSDVVYDLGSGDGRVVIKAAQKYGAKAVGIELDLKLAEESKQKVREADLEKLVTIVRGDMLKIDLKPATVVTIYLPPESNAKLRPILEKGLTPGTRVVSHAAPIPGWTWVRTAAINVGNSWRYIFLYQVPEAFAK